MFLEKKNLLKVSRGDLPEESNVFRGTGRDIWMLFLAFVDCTCPAVVTVHRPVYFFDISTILSDASKNL